MEREDVLVVEDEQSAGDALTCVPLRKFAINCVPLKRSLASVYHRTNFILLACHFEWNDYYQRLTQIHKDISTLLSYGGDENRVI